MEDKYVFSLYIRVIKRRDVIHCILLLRLCLRNRSCPPVSTGLFRIVVSHKILFSV